MDDNKEIINKLLEEKIVAVLRAKSKEEGMKYVKACIEGGINAIELTYSIPDVCSLLEEVCQKYPEVLIGIGSVLNKEDAKKAHLAGAIYVVSPGYVDQVQEYCNKHGVIYMPGAMTVSEILSSMNQNNAVTKLFPGDIFSPKYIKAIKAPVPNLKLMVTGGVSIDNIEEWFDAGVSLIGVGSSLTKPGEIGNYEEVTAIAKRFKEKLK